MLQVNLLFIERKGEINIGFMYFSYDVSRKKQTKNPVDFTIAIHQLMIYLHFIFK